MSPARMAEIHAAAFAGRERPWSGAEIAEMLRGPGVEAVTFDDTGFALLRILPPEAEILTFAVAPRVQRQGVGRTLLGRALEVAAQGGAGTVHLDVAADNAPALALYRAAGFGEAGRRRGYYRRADGSRADALLLSHFLGAENSGTRRGS